MLSGPMTFKEGGEQFFVPTHTFIEINGALLDWNSVFAIREEMLSGGMQRY